jgi:hypothetical protein
MLKEDQSMPDAKEVHITIDRKKYESPNPTTGHALYVLGNIQPGYDLFRETHGPGDDQLIPNDNTVIELRDGEKFYSAQSTLNPGT